MKQLVIRMATRPPSRSRRRPAEDQLQVPFTGAHPVQALTPGTADPALGDRVRRGARGGVLRIPMPAAVNTL